MLLACSHLGKVFTCQFRFFLKILSPQLPWRPLLSPLLRGLGRRTGQASPNQIEIEKSAGTMDTCYAILHTTTQHTSTYSRADLPGVQAHAKVLQLMIPTSQGKSLEIDPLSLSTSLASNHHISPMLLEPLLLHGTAMSMNLVGESMLQSATIGMLA